MFGKYENVDIKNKQLVGFPQAVFLGVVMANLSPITKDTLSDKAYRIIKETIVSNEYKPGDILTEEMLAEQLSISRTPIRDALKKLQYEHILTPGGGKKLVVSEVSEQDIQNVTVVRSNLEKLAVTLLEGKMTDEKKEHLKELLDRCKKLAGQIQNGDELEYLEADTDFHMFIAECAQNTFLYDMIDRTMLVNKRFHVLSGTLNQYSKKAVDEHETIVQYIINDEYEKAARSMKEHIDSAGDRMLVKE